MLYFILLVICFLPMVIIVPLKIIGKKNLPKKGNFILTSNHASNWDPVIIYARLPRKYFTMAKAELYKNKLFGAFLKAFHAFPVKRGGNDIESVKYTLRTLKQGKRTLLIFPEGTRAKSDDYEELKNGTAMFALKTAKPIVPVTFVRKNKLFRRNVMIIGKPYVLSEMEDFKDKPVTKELLNSASEIIGNKMKELKDNYLKEQEDVKRHRNSRKHKEAKNNKNSQEVGAKK